jgi:hypothetical protein
MTSGAFFAANILTSFGYYFFSVDEKKTLLHFVLSIPCGLSWALI